MPGLVIDERHAKRVGEWTFSSSVEGFVDNGYRHDGDQRDGKASAHFASDKPLEKGRYEVRLAYTPEDNRSSKTSVVVIDSNGEHRKAVNQRKSPGKDGFVLLGVFEFDGKTRPAVTIGNSGADGYVIIDAVQWIEKKP